MVRRALLAAIVGIATMLEGCRCIPFEAPAYKSESCSPQAMDGTDKPTALMDFSRLGSDFFSAPFPSLGRTPNGDLDSGSFPAGTALTWRARKLLPKTAGISSGIFFELTGPIVRGTVLPEPFTKPTGLPRVMLFPIGGKVKLAPINVDVSRARFADAPGGDVLERFLLSLVPVQGTPLLTDTLYAAVVQTAVAQPSETMRALCRNEQAIGASSPTYLQAIDQLRSEGLPCNEIAAMATFRTGDPTLRMRQVTALAHSDFIAHRGACKIRLHREDAVDRPGPRCSQGPFCVFSGKVRVPVYQIGTPPYFPYVAWNGGWPANNDVPLPTNEPPGCDADDFEPEAPAPPWTPLWRSARVVVTLPHRKPISDRGYPVAALVRTGGGSTTDTLVDRGPLLTPSCKETACRGPAEVFQSVGFAGLTVDGPLVGLSRMEPIELNEDVGIFDFLNPEALVDNIRQSAVELTLLPDIVPLLEIDSSECEHAEAGNPTKLDADHIALFAHSMGATIAPLALANQPKFGAAILSGAGGSIIENALYKKQPVPINAAASLLGFACVPRERDPALSMLQWSLEPSDAQVYAPQITRNRHVLMIQGIVDHYILPPIADVMVLGAGLDLGLGPGSCNGDPRCDHQPVFGEVASPDHPSLDDLLDITGGRRLPLATTKSNSPTGTTSLVVQHRIDENREINGTGCNVDGHEVIYESLLARHQYACFLSDFAENKPPMVRETGHELAGCQ